MHLFEGVAMHRLAAAAMHSPEWPPASRPTCVCLTTSSTVLP
jgi:hypothetical protein